MSLINQMLKDLEKRRHAQAMREELRSTLHVVDAESAPIASWVVALGSCLVLGGLSAAGWSYWQHQPKAVSFSPPNEPAPTTPNGKTTTDLEFVKGLPEDHLQPSLTDHQKLKSVQENTAHPQEPPRVGNAAPITPETIVDAAANGANPIPASAPTATEEVTMRPHAHGHRHAAGNQGSATGLSRKRPQPVQFPQNPAITATSTRYGTQTDAPPTQSAESLYLQARRLQASHEDDRAQDNLERSLRLDPGHRGARLQLAQRYLALGDHHAAEELLEGRPELQNDSEAIRLRAQLLLKRGQIKQSESLLDSAAANSVSDPDLMGVKAALKQRQGQYPAAAALYRQAIRYQPGQAKWWLGLAICLDATEHYNEALQAYEHTLSLGAPTRASLNYIESRIATLRGAR